MPGQGLQPETLSVVPGVYGNPQRPVGKNYIETELQPGTGFGEIRDAGPWLFLEVYEAVFP